MQLRILFSALLPVFNACALCANELPADSISAAALGAECAVPANGESGAALEEKGGALPEAGCEILPVASDAIPPENASFFPAANVCAAAESEFFNADSATRFRPVQIAFPAAAIALGGAGVKNHLFDTSGDRSHTYSFDDGLQYVPVAGYALLGFVPGVQHRHNFGERVLAGATAYLTLAAACEVAKVAISEPRPDASDSRSFPSGHTAKAFCGAELCRLEYGNVYGAVAYAFAATTGVMRVVNNRHWCNDVLAGAGIGFLSARVGYWLLPWEKKVVRRVFKRSKSVDTASSPFLLAPTYEYNAKAPGLTFSMIF